MAASGQWKDWHGTWGIPYIWTSLPLGASGGALYTALLHDLDQLLATDPTFLLGSWLAEARRLGGNATDCTDIVLGEKLSRCDDFMEWNARAQLTTWHPVAAPPGHSGRPASGVQMRLSSR
eukprot:SAG22_NODE_8881_length_624_cov_0.971429_1_plen_120_part_10